MAELRVARLHRLDDGTPAGGQLDVHIEPLFCPIAVLGGDVAGRAEQVVDDDERHRLHGLAVAVTGEAGDRQRENSRGRDQPPARRR